MGQAKSRGILEARIQQARDRVESLRPTSMECVHCKAQISDLIDLEPPSHAGLDAAFSGLCLHCGLVNYSIFGPEANVREAYRLLALDKLERYKSRRPEPINCETCEAKLHDVTELPTEGMRGITSAHAAPCTGCRRPTYLVLGEPRAVAEVRQKLAAAGFMESL